MFLTLVFAFSFLFLNFNCIHADVQLDPSSSEYENLRLTLQDMHYEEQLVRECSAAGPMCKTCNMTVLCINMGSHIEEHAGALCPDDQTCLETKCVNTTNPHCSDIVNFRFPCAAPGMYPNQFDCRKYQMCVPIINEEGTTVITPFTVTCSNGYKYNSKSTYCDIKLVNNQCFEDVNVFPIPLCEENGKVGVVPSNPSIFYICEIYPGEGILYPFLYLCDNGLIFDVATLTCIVPPKP